MIQISEFDEKSAQEAVNACPAIVQQYVALLKQVIKIQQDTMQTASKDLIDLLDKMIKE
jgi:hypothetical protein